MTNVNIPQIESKVKATLGPFLRARDEIKKVIVGQLYLIDRLFIALLSDGHVLLEGLPGLAKTLTVTTLAKTMNCESKRIQFTPDLLPADLIGTQIYLPKEGTFTIKKGPIFTHILLADEINRAPPKVQSALLEVMQERQVTIGTETFPLQAPFLVLATQNPIEQAGTYSLPEAQVDRFMMKVKIDYPSFNEEKEIIARMGNLQAKPEPSPTLDPEEIFQAREAIDQIYIDDKVLDYLLKIIFATRNPKEAGVPIEKLLEFGASPRASIALKIGAKAHAFLEGRGFVIPHDIKMVANDILRHRLRLSYEAEAEEITAEEVIQRILESIRVP